MDAYGVIEIYGQRIIDLEKVDFYLQWDADVTMPEQGGPARASQRTTVAAAKHRYLTSDELDEAFAAVDDDSLTEKQRAVVREIRREQEIERRVPTELNDRLEEAQSDAYEAWKTAKVAEDFDQYAPHLQQNIDCHREWAAAVAPDKEAFEALWSKKTGYLSQPHIELATVEALFDDLIDGLVPLIDRIREEGTDPDPVFTGTYDESTQFELNQAALDLAGYDASRTRLDVAPHPFSLGTPYDTRIMTRFDEDDPLVGLLSTLHEYGHTMYTLGLPAEHYGSPLGEPRGLGIHESQARFVENHIGRTEAFWEAFLPTMVEHFPELEGTTPREAYKAVNRVYYENPVRTSADELTYHLHIILRHELERELLSGTIRVGSVEDAWRRKSEEYLGIVPEFASEGPLQDPHWSTKFPAFATYTVGSVLAAQLHAAMEDDLGSLDSSLRNGNIEPIEEWLREHVHRHGCRYRADELIRRATGEDLSADAFLDYVEHKYSDIYGL